MKTENSTLFKTDYNFKLKWCIGLLNLTLYYLSESLWIIHIRGHTLKKGVTYRETKAKLLFQVSPRMEQSNHCFSGKWLFNLMCWRITKLRENAAPQWKIPNFSSKFEVAYENSPKMGLNSPFPHQHHDFPKTRENSPNLAALVDSQMRVPTTAVLCF